MSQIVVAFLMTGAGIVVVCMSGGWRWGRRRQASGGKIRGGNGLNLYGVTARDAELEKKGSMAVTSAWMDYVIHSP